MSNQCRFESSPKGCTNPNCHFWHSSTPDGHSPAQGFASGTRHQTGPFKGSAAYGKPHPASHSQGFASGKPQPASHSQGFASGKPRPASHSQGFASGQQHSPTHSHGSAMVQPHSASYAQQKLPKHLVPCRFNLGCTNPYCDYHHDTQSALSPAAFVDEDEEQMFLCEQVMLAELGEDGDVDYEDYEDCDDDYDEDLEAAERKIEEAELRQMAAE